MPVTTQEAQGLELVTGGLATCEVRRVLQDPGIARQHLPGGPLAVSLRTLHGRLIRVRSLGGTLGEVEASPYLHQLFVSLGFDQPDQSAVA